MNAIQNYLPPQLLIVTGTPHIALQLASELRAFDAIVSLAASFDAGAATAHTLLDPASSDQSMVIIIDIASVDKASEAFGLMSHLTAAMGRGLLRVALIIGLADQCTLDMDAAAQASGCTLLLEQPLSASAAHLIAEQAGLPQPQHSDLMAIWQPITHSMKQRTEVAL